MHHIKPKQAISSVFFSSNVYITRKLSSQVPKCLCKSKILTFGVEINFLLDARLSSFGSTQPTRALGGCFFISMHLIELYALQVMLLKRSVSLQRDVMLTFNPWCPLLKLIKGHRSPLKTRQRLTIRALTVYEESLA